MALRQSVPLTPHHPSPIVLSRRAAGGTVLWLRGEHDASTTPALAEVMAKVIALDDDDVVADLSEVEFMDAATVAVLARAREFLERRSRSLELRSPSPPARRVLELCGVGELCPEDRIRTIQDNGRPSR